MGPWDLAPGKYLHPVREQHYQQHEENGQKVPGPVPALPRWSICLQSLATAPRPSVRATHIDAANTGQTACTALLGGTVRRAANDWVPRQLTPAW